MSDFNFLNHFSSVEIKKSAGGSVIVFPSVDGSGTVGISSATANLYKGNVSVSSPSVTISAFGSGSRLSIPIQSGLDYSRESIDYRVEVEWTTVSGSYVGYSTIPFEVVYQPWGDSTVTYDDMVAMSEIRGQLESIADEQGKTARQVASQFAAMAHADLDIWIRNRSSEEGCVRARAILDRARLHGVEVKLAIAKLWGYYMGGDETTDQPTMLHDRWFKDAQGSFQALGNLRYDTNDDGTADVTLGAMGRSIRMVRVRR